MAITGAVVHVAVLGRRAVGLDNAGDHGVVAGLVVRRPDRLAVVLEVAAPRRGAGPALYLGEGTVRNYLSSAIVKLSARNRTEAFAFARDKGYL